MSEAVKKPAPHTQWTKAEAPGMKGPSHPFKRLRVMLERHDRLSSTQRLVLLTLVAFVDEYGVAWPARGRLETLTGLAPRTLRYAVRALEKNCIISIILPRDGRNIHYSTKSRGTLKVPDFVCMYFLWPLVPVSQENYLRRLVLRLSQPQSPTA